MAAELSGGLYGTLLTAGCVLLLLALACGCASRRGACAVDAAPRPGRHKRDHVV